MSQLIVWLFVCILSVPLHGVEAATDPDRPDIAKWHLISTSKISVRVSDKVAYYLGFDMEYQNPDNLNEYVRQIKVLIPFVVVKSRAIQDKNFVDTMITYATDGAERQLLSNYKDKSDPILYIRWRQKDELIAKTAELDRTRGDYEVWFWNSGGEWVYAQNVKIKKDYSSEFFRELNNELIIVGIKYSLSKQDYNAREIPYYFLSIAMRASRGGK